MLASHARRITLGLFVVFVDLVAAGSELVAAESGNPHSDKQEAAALEGLRDQWLDLMSAMGVPGMAVVVVKGDDVLLLDTLGVRDPRTGHPVTSDTLFYIASCTKSYVAMAIMQLAEDRKLDLDAPVKKYLPRFKVADDTLTNTLTVRELLSHAKGLDSGPIVWLDAYTGEITEERYYHWLGKANAKGSLEYTNVHYTLLGRILESITGKSWKAVLQERVFDPAGMTRTTCSADNMYADKDVANPCVTGDESPKLATVRKTDRTMHAAGGMGTSIKDLATMLRIQLNQGVINGKRLFSQKSAAQMHTMQEAGRMPTLRLPGLSRDGYGFGWFIGKYKNKTHIDHGGGYVGARSIISFIPEEKLGVAVVANHSSALPVAVAMDIYDRLLGLEGRKILPLLLKQARRNRSRADCHPELTHNPATTDRGLSLAAGAYAGTYTNTHWGTVQVRYQGGVLVGSMGDLSLQFGSKGLDRFLVVYGTGQPDEGYFVIADDGEVSEMVLSSEDFEGEAHFVRR